MCGIFGIIGKTKIYPKEMNKLINFALEEGRTPVVSCITIMLTKLKRLTLILKS